MERELEAELRFHLEMQTAEFIRQGMPPERARRAARQALGDVDRLKDDVRDTWLTRTIETVIQDARYGLRGLRRHAGYTAAVLVTMALGIGANSAIFSVVHAVVLSPLPYERGDDLVLMQQPRGGYDNAGFSLLDIDDIGRLSASLDSLSEYHGMYFILLGGAEPARVATGVVSWNYFETLGLEPLLGRTFRAEDDRHDAPATLVLSYDYWQRELGGDPGVVGRVFQMNDRPHTVVGVLPDVPMYPQANDVYMPRTSCPFRMSPENRDRRGSGMASALGRRRNGSSLADLNADLTQVGAALQTAYPVDYRADAGHRIVATPLRREFTRNFESTLVVLLGTSAFVLLIVVASVANLAVARTMRRDRELALRTALGASRRRLLRQLLTESAILSLAGGLAGLVLAVVARDLLASYVARFTPRASEIRIDASVLWFTLTLSLLTGLLSNTLPALSRYLRPGRAGAAAAGTVRRGGVRRALIVAQVAASFMLLVGAGLLTRSLMKLAEVDPGFSTERVLTLQLDMDFSRYRSDTARTEYLARVEAALASLPDVSSVGASGTLPFLDDSRASLTHLAIEGEPPPPLNRGPQASLMIATAAYFEAMNIPLLRGRAFAVDDRLGGPTVVIINQLLAQRLFPGGDPIGRRISDGDDDWATIVGVVASVRQQLAVEPVAEIYVPMAQLPYVTTNWVLRSERDLDAIAPLVREAIHDVDPNQPIHRMRPLTDARAASLLPPRLTAALIGLFAALALVITATGIAGVIAFSVNQRSQEFGVRMALGAAPVDVVSMVVREGMTLALKGLAIGAAGAIVLGGVFSTLLFEVTPTDGVTYAIVSFLLMIVAALACLLPALRAASVDPMNALRPA